MRKEKTIFLFSLLIAASLLISACTQSASTGQVPTQEDADIQGILDAIENQPKVEITPSEVPSVDTQPEPTETPAALSPVETEAPTPVPTKEIVAVDLTVPDKYTLKKGEFPWCLARRFNVDVTTLMNVNGLSGSHFEPGKVLTIPKDAKAYQGNRTLNAHPTTYTVKSGDTFYSIACYFGDVWPEQIAAQNSMTLSDALTSGTKLDIP